MLLLPNSKVKKENESLGVSEGGGNARPLQCQRQAARRFLPSRWYFFCLRSVSISEHLAALPCSQAGLASSMEGYSLSERHSGVPTHFCFSTWAAPTSASPTGWGPLLRTFLSLTVNIWGDWGEVAQCGENLFNPSNLYSTKSENSFLSQQTTQIAKKLKLKIIKFPNVSPQVLWGFLKGLKLMPPSKNSRSSSLITEITEILAP